MKFLFVVLLALFCLAIGCKAQDSLRYTNTELIYGRKDGMALTMFKLTPKSNSNGKAIISVVSGNWISSYNYAAYLVSRAKIYVDKGYTVFVTMHGSQPRYAIPDEIVDLKRAVRFIRYNAKLYNIDPDHIGITGSSSGGHLSLMIGLSDDTVDNASKDPVDKVSSRVQAVAVFFPPTDFLNWGQQNTNLVAAKAGLAAAGVASAFDYKEWNDTTKTYKSVTAPQKFKQIVQQTSPIYKVSADDPPVFVIHGDADKTVPLQQSELLMTKLKTTNVASQLVVKKGGGHGWKNIEADEQQFVDWFDKYLK